MDQKKIQFLKNLSTGLVVVAVVFAFLIAGIRIFGIQVYGVLTGSMEPTYPTGSLIYVKAVDASKLRVNDVITFSISPNVIATHRIVEIVPDETYPTIVRYRTKGDANRDVDASLVSANNIIGKALFAIPQLGYLASYIQQPPGIYVAILVCGLMIAFVFYTDSLENKQKNEQSVQDSDKAHFGLVTLINRFSRKILGKPLIKEKTPADSSFRQGYIPQQSVPQPAQYMSPQQAVQQPAQYMPPQQAVQQPAQYVSPQQSMQQPAQYVPPQQAVQQPAQYASPQQLYSPPNSLRGQSPQSLQQNFSPQMYRQPYYGAQNYPQQGYQQQRIAQEYSTQWQQPYYPQQGGQLPQQLQSQLCYPQQYYVQHDHGQSPYQPNGNVKRPYNVVPQNAQQGAPLSTEQEMYAQPRRRYTGQK